MQKVVNISLNGNSYQLEEPGYEQLRAYLERAEARLTGSPDRAEVMADLEQAIGEKCRGMLGPHKSVVSSEEVERIIVGHGPGRSGGRKSARRRAAARRRQRRVPRSSRGLPPRKRLFKIREGAMWGGVCNGVAAYMGVDVTWVRIGAVVLTLFTGVTIFVYLGMLIIVPYADTAEDRAAAFGVPFNTEDIIGRAKKNFDETNQRWHAEWRRQQRHWNRQFRHMNEQLRTSAAQVAPHMGPAARGIMAVFLPIAAIVGAVMFVVLDPRADLAGHAALDLRLGAAAQRAAVGRHIALVLIYVLVSAPFKMVRDGGAWRGGLSPGLARAAHSVDLDLRRAADLLGRVHFLPGVRELVDNLMWAANLTVTTISETIV